jgi:ribonuclease P protein component
VRAFDSLRGRREFTLVMRRGKAGSGGPLTVFGLVPRAADTQRTKVGIIIPKTVGTAVERNRLRRRCKSILDRQAFRAPHQWYVIQCRPGAAGLTFEELHAQLKSALARAGDPRPARPAKGRA